MRSDKIGHSFATLLARHIERMVLQKFLTLEYQLVQVVGQSFQQVEYRTVFLLYPLLHSPIGDELPHDLDGLLTRLPGQSLEPEM